MMLPESTRRRIETLAASTNPVDRAVARRLAGQLPRTTTSASSGGTDVRARTRWAHVDLADLFAHYGNTVSSAGERLKTGHEPVHGSRSGTCVVAWPETGRWWCSSCGRSGDAAGLVMAALGVKYPAAASWLAERYPSSADQGAELSRRRTSRSKPRPYNANVRCVVVGGGSGA
jgi:hypothetical protein